MTLPAAYPEVFQRAVARVARIGGAPLSQIAEDFGVAEGNLSNWLKRADIDDGVRSGVATSAAVVLQEVKQRNTLLEQENEILLSAATYFAKQLSPT